MGGNINIINVTVSEDEMTAVLRVSSMSGEVSWDEIEKSLKKNNVSFGINKETIEKIVNEKMFDQDIVVATGTMPIPGADTRIEYFFETKSKEPKPIVREDGSVDHYNLDTVKQVQEKELLVRMTPPTRGISGSTVTGKELRTSNGRDLAVRPGNNVYQSDDGLELYAKIAGTPKLIGVKVHVSSQYIIDSDVDFSTGNIEFSGDIVIKGDILDGFKVTATGNIDVYGNIKNAFVEAHGTINALGGIVAKDKGHVKAGVNVNTIFVESATVEAGHNVDVKRAIMHSTIKAGNSVFCQEGKGLIVGGEVKAGVVIQAKEIGSEYATKTRLIAGKVVDLKEQLDVLGNEFEKCRENYNKLKGSQTKLEETLNLLQVSQAEQQKIEQLKGLLAKTVEAQQGVMAQIKDIRDKRQEVTDQLEHLKPPRVCVSGSIYPGVELSMNGYKYRIEKPITYVSFYEDEGKIKPGKFIHLEKE